MNQKIRLFSKRPRQENRLVQHPRSSSIPRSIVSNVQGFDMFLVIRGFQDNMSNWMSSLIQQQDGCLQMVAQRANLGRVQQEQHIPLPGEQRCHLQVIKYHIYVRNSHIGSTARPSPRRARQSLRPRGRSSSTYASIQQ